MGESCGGGATVPSSVLANTTHVNVLEEVPRGAGPRQRRNQRRRRKRGRDDHAAADKKRPCRARQTFDDFSGFFARAHRLVVHVTSAALLSSTAPCGAPAPAPAPAAPSPASAPAPDGRRRGPSLAPTPRRAAPTRPDRPVPAGAAARKADGRIAPPLVHVGDGAPPLPRPVLHAHERPRRSTTTELALIGLRCAIYREAEAGGCLVPALLLVCGGRCSSLPRLE